MTERRRRRPTPLEVARKAVATLRRFRLAQNTERELQSAIADALTQARIPFEREAKLSSRDRPDFLLEQGVALEVKTKGALSSVCTQLTRYAEHDRVTVVVLVSTRRVHVAPEELAGKPVLSVCVGSGLL